MLGEFFPVRRRRRRNVKASYFTRGDLSCPFMIGVRLDDQRLAQVRTRGLKFFRLVVLATLAWPQSREILTLR
jgi:hypothetical protein